jgi:hypothetical protein
LENLRESDHLGDPSVDETIILNWIFRKSDMGLNKIDLAQNRNGWNVLVDVIMGLPVP